MKKQAPREKLRRSMIRRRPARWLHDCGTVSRDLFSGRSIVKEVVIVRNYTDFYDEEELEENEFEYMTPREVMYALGIGRNTFYRLVNSGELKGFRIGKLWRVRREDLQDFCR